MRENKDVKVQIRITPTEKALLEKLTETDGQLTISRLFRDALQEKCDKLGIKIDPLPVENIAQVPQESV